MASTKLLYTGTIACRYYGKASKVSYEVEPGQTVTVDTRDVDQLTTIRENKRTVFEKPAKAAKEDKAE